MNNNHNNNGSSASDINFFERLNYFFGKLLTVRDFQAEQSYFNEKRWLLNRQAIGWGVVCGMNVREKPDCPTKNQVIVEPGLALDKYGNEILVGSEQIVDLFSKAEAAPTTKTEYYIGIRYKECLSEPVPAPVQECSKSKEQCLYSRVRELFELKSFKGSPPNSGPEIEIGCAKMVTERCDDIENPCKSREKCQWIILAKVIFDNGKIEHIDNQNHRKWLWSNEDLAICLRDTMLRVKVTRTDRRQFVPLLAQTIKGLNYRDGRILTITNIDHWAKDDSPGKVKRNVGIQPYDITTDGDWIWFTDLASDENKSVLKINREGTTVKKLSVEEKSWGIAFDGCYMWVTHPENKSVSKIPKSATSCDTLDPPINIDKENPRDIIYARNYVWIARKGGITRIEVKTDEKKQIELEFTPIAMAFDGIFIWLVYNGDGEKTKIKKIDLEGKLYLNDSPISLEEGDPKSIAFDGTHMWVTHEDGVSQIDINENEVEKKVDVDKTLTGAAFDGMYLWAAEPKSERVDRIDIHARERVSEVRPSEHLGGDYRNFSKMCFDGMFIWVTDYTGVEGEPENGVIHRLLV